MRYLLAALLALHGLLHLLGLQWGKVTGAIWAIAAAALLTAAALLMAASARWWMVAAAALVFGHWSAARAGTILNLVLAIPVAMAALAARFEHHSAAARSRLLSHLPA